MTSYEDFVWRRFHTISFDDIVDFFYSLLEYTDRLRESFEIDLNIPALGSKPSR